MSYDIVIVGAGIAGLTAAIYARRAGKSVLVLEANAFGGQIINTPDVENYPGESRISGADLMYKIYSQARDLGAEIEIEKVTKIQRAGELFEVETEDDEYSARSIILACGTQNRRMGLPNEEKLIGHGVSFCATCDGALYKDKAIAVYGGGNSALSEANYLADICKKVYLIYRSEKPRAKGNSLEKFRKHENTVEIPGAKISSLLESDNKLRGVELTNGQELELDALFVSIGREASVDFIDVEKDADGFVMAGEDCKTSIDGVFVAGDIRTKHTRQLVTAAGDGAVAANAAIEYLQ